jgi:hypothetical protein
MKRFTTKIASFVIIMATFCQTIQAQTCVTISEPAVLDLTLAASTINCTGGTSTITVTGSGGTAAYQYKLGTGAYQAGNTFAGLVAGTYAVEIKDAKGCTMSKSITINQPTSLAVTMTTTENSCTANDNKVIAGATYNMTAAATGGTGAYTYTWSDNTLGSTATVAATVAMTTTYTVSVTDANNCPAATATATATVITGPTVSITGLAAAYCKDVPVITLAGTATPASGTFTVDGNIATTLDPSAVALAAGNHSVVYTYTDGNGCSASATKAVAINALPTFTLASTNVTCNGAADGTITITVTSGASPYEYSNDNGAVGSYAAPDVATTKSYLGLAARVAPYKPTVKDANGCVMKCQ